MVYKFVLSPFKVGVFDYSAPVEEGDEDVDPSRWCPPSTEEDDPVEFAQLAVSRRLGECVTEATERWNNRHIQKIDEDDEAYDTRIRKLDDEDKDGYEDVEWRSNVDLVDDNVSQLFGRSRVRGEREFPEFHTNLRGAISIACHAQDPLAELCYA